MMPGESNGATSQNPRRLRTAESRRHEVGAKPEDFAGAVGWLSEEVAHFPRKGTSAGCEVGKSEVHGHS